MPGLRGAATCSIYLGYVTQHHCPSNRSHNQNTCRGIATSGHNIAAIVTNPRLRHGRVPANVTAAKTGRCESEIVGAAVGCYVEVVRNRRVRPKNIFFGTATSKIAIKIDATFTLVFKSEAPINDTIFQEYKRRVLHFTVWPFLRELTHSMTSRMGLPALTLPMIKNL